ncbi:MAG: hypothetical protein H6726_19165 [Sandaracinaceae bacterium]|nr:hypothetical protein [Sandaracinaceae bacterium]
MGLVGSETCVLDANATARTLVVLALGGRYLSPQSRLALWVELGNTDLTPVEASLRRSPSLQQALLDPTLATSVREARDDFTRITLAQPRRLVPDPDHGLENLEFGEPILSADRTQVALSARLGRYPGWTGLLLRDVGEIRAVRTGSSIVYLRSSDFIDVYRVLQAYQPAVVEGNLTISVQEGPDVDVRVIAPSFVGYASHALNPDPRVPLSDELLYGEVMGRSLAGIAARMVAALLPDLIGELGSSPCEEAILEFIAASVTEVPTNLPTTIGEIDGWANDVLTTLIDNFHTLTACSFIGVPPRWLSWLADKVALVDDLLDAIDNTLDLVDVVGGSPFAFHTLELCSVCCAGGECPTACGVEAGTLVCCASGASTAEICNGVDDDCDGASDEGVETAYYQDCDGDTFGALDSSGTLGCSAPSAGPSECPLAGWSTSSSDCDDGNASVNPGATEICNALDDDCNGTTNDEPDAAVSCAASTPPNAIAVCENDSCSHVCEPAYVGALCDGCAVGYSGYPECRPVLCGDSSCGPGETSANCCEDCGCGVGSTCLGAMCTIAGAQRIAAGHRHTCVVARTGEVYCWGSNSDGQLGNGTSGSGSVALLPVRVTGITNARTVALGEAHSCAVLNDGAVWCWGRNTNGQLGDGSTIRRTVPVASVGVTDAAQLGAGADFTCVRTTGGAVRCWGSNGSGQSGVGTSGGNTLLASTAAIELGVLDVSVGFAHVCAVRTSGTVECWGYGETGRVTGLTWDHASYRTPQTVAGVSGALRVAAGDQHTCALIDDGSQLCWGGNQFGQCGRGSTFWGGGESPGAVANLDATTAIEAGTNHSCAVDGDGTIWCWGPNADGRIGDGSTDNALSPRAVQGITDALEVTAGGSHTCALSEQGAVWCWGRALEGQLGDGTTGGAGGYRAAPVTVVGTEPGGPIN